MMIAIRRASADRVEELAGVIGRAFAADPLAVWPIRGTLDPDPRGVGAMLRIRLERYADAGVLYETEDGRGCAAWVAPDELEAVAAPPENRRRMAAITDDGGARLDAIWDWIRSRARAEPVWFLPLLGVDPDVQGNGRGTALVRHGLDRAHAAGLPASTETSSERNVRFYERLGFAVVDEGDTPVGGHHVWFLRADPRR